MAKHSGTAARQKLAKLRRSDEYRNGELIAYVAGIAEDAVRPANRSSNAGITRRLGASGIGSLTDYAAIDAKYEEQLSRSQASGWEE